MNTNIKFKGNSVFITKYNKLSKNFLKHKNNNYLFLIINNMYIKNYFFSNYYINNFFKRQNYTNNSNIVYYKYPYNCLKRPTTYIKNMNQKINIINFFSNQIIGNMYKIEIVGYSRRLSLNTQSKQLFLRLGSSFVNIKKISKDVLIKISKMRLLFFYSLNTSKLKSFITQLIMLKPTTAYKKTGVIFFNSKITIKKKKTKSF